MSNGVEAPPTGSKHGPCMCRVHVRTASAVGRVSFGSSDPYLHRVLEADNLLVIHGGYQRLSPWDTPGSGRGNGGTESAQRKAYLARVEFVGHLSWGQLCRLLVRDQHLGSSASHTPDRNEATEVPHNSPTRHAVREGA